MNVQMLRFQFSLAFMETIFNKKDFSAMNSDLCCSFHFNDQILRENIL